MPPLGEVLRPWFRLPLVALGAFTMRRAISDPCVANELVPLPETPCSSTEMFLAGPISRAGINIVVKRQQLSFRCSPVDVVCYEVLKYLSA